MIHLIHRVCTLIHTQQHSLYVAQLLLVQQQEIHMSNLDKNTLGKITQSYKQRLALAVNRIPKAAVYPYGKLKMYQAIGGTKAAQTNAQLWRTSTWVD